MTRSDLIARLFQRFQLQTRDIEFAVQLVQGALVQALQDGRRIEIRGFGNFTVHDRLPRKGRNPKTGETLLIPAKGYARFSAGKDLRAQIARRNVPLGE
jgi:integration host factor subunit beta